MMLTVDAASRSDVQAWRSSFVSHLRIGVSCMQAVGLRILDSGDLQCMKRRLFRIHGVSLRTLKLLTGITCTECCAEGNRGRLSFRGVDQQSCATFVYKRDRLNIHSCIPELVDLDRNRIVVCA